MLYFKSYEFSNFYGFFLNFSDFYELIWIYFELKRIKKLSRADVAQAKMGRHMVVYVHTMWCMAYACVRVRD